jgi:hypothetical protein
VQSDDDTDSNGPDGTLPPPAPFTAQDTQDVSAAKFWIPALNADDAALEDMVKAMETMHTEAIKSKIAMSKLYSDNMDAQADETRKQGTIEFGTAVSGGVMSTAISTYGAYKTVDGSMEKMRGQDGKDAWKSHNEQTRILQTHNATPEEMENHREIATQIDALHGNEFHSGRHLINGISSESRGQVAQQVLSNAVNTMFQAGGDLGKKEAEAETTELSGKGNLQNQAIGNANDQASSVRSDTKSVIQLVEERRQDKANARNKIFA